METIGTDFDGITTFRLTGVHETEVYIGVLSSGLIPDIETLDTKSVDFGETAEQYAMNIRGELDFESKGLLVVVCYPAMSIKCAVVAGEALTDSDVKFEMYKLMGF